MSVNVAAPLNITLYRDRERGGIPQNFDQAFPEPLFGGGQRNVDQLSPETREALLAFVQKESPPTGLQLPGVRLLERKRGRHIRLYDRQAGERSRGTYAIQFPGLDEVEIKRIFRY